MKKTLFFLLFVFCSNEVVVDESEPLVTTEVVVNTTTKLDDTDLMLDNFHKWWISNKLKESNIYLNPTETEYTNNFISQFIIDDRDTSNDPFLYYPYKNNPFSKVVIYDLHDSYEGDFTICNKIKGAAGTAILDEIHPLEDSYLTSHTYTCVNDETTLLFGFPYFQDGKWWIFKSIPNSEKIITEDCEDPCGSIYTHWATKIEFRPIRGTFFDQQTEQIEFLDDFSENYDEISYEVPHDVINFAIFYPKINFNQECANII